MDFWGDEEAPAVGKGELLLLGICDWTFFERRLTDDPDFEMPAAFLADKLKLESWNNIPPAVHNSIEAFKMCFGKTSNILSELFRQTKTRTEHIASKIKRMEQGLENASATLRRQLEHHNRKMSEKLEHN